MTFQIKRFIDWIRRLQCTDNDISNKALHWLDKTITVYR